MIFCFCLAITKITQAEVRLIEGADDPEIAARGFTGVSACTDLSCLEWNPAFLYSKNEDVRSFASIGTRFNESLFTTADDWEQTKGLFASDRYREQLLKTWNFISRQTAKASADIGLRVKSFGFSHSPANFGAVLFGHDPVLPFGELYTYAFSGIRLGYAYNVQLTTNKIKSLIIGAAFKHTSATTNKFIFDPLSNKFDLSEKINGQWIVARLGVTATLDTPMDISVSAIISGIPIYKHPIKNIPDTDYPDLQPGASIELYRVWWGHISGYYSLSRLTRNESFWLKQHAGLESTVGKFKMAIGVSDAMLTYGLTLALPMAKFSVATYGVEYSDLSHNLTDRVYWFRIEI